VSVHGKGGTKVAKPPRAKPGAAAAGSNIARGLAMLRRMGREATVDDQKALDPALYELTVGHLFGDIWTRPGLSLRDRQLVTLAANLALVRPGHANESHFRSALHVGISRAEIVEVLIQIGHYAGWPALATGVDQFGRVLAEAGAKATARTSAKTAAKTAVKTTAKTTAKTTGKRGAKAGAARPVSPRQGQKPR